MELDCVILFGSRARGDHTRKSDIDLIIVGDFQEKFIYRPLKLLEFNQTNHALELFCYTPQEFETMFLRGEVIILDALDEGIPLMGEFFFRSYKKRFDELVQEGLKRSRCSWILPM